MQRIFLLLFIFLPVRIYAQPYIIDQVVAVVGNKPIKQSDVEGMYLQLRTQGMPMRGDMKCNIFEELLTQKLLCNQAEVDSLTVEPGEVERTLNQRLDQFIRQIGSQEKLEDYFKKSIYEIKDDLRKSLHEQLLAQKMRNEIVQNIKITPSEVRSYYNSLSKDSIPLINGQVEVAQIMMYPPYSEEAINDVRQKLLDLRKRIVNGENFRTLAVLYSEEPAATKTGGEIGLMSKGMLDPEYAKAAWALKNKGDVSRIVKSQFGYHIIQLVEKRGDEVNTRHLLMNPKADPEAIEKVSNRLDSIAKRIRVDSLDWNAAAFFYSQDENTRFNKGLTINPNDFGTKFELSQLDRLEYSIIKELKVGEISEPFASKDSKGKTAYKIVKIMTMSDPHRANLKDDYNFLQEMTREHKIHLAVNEWVDQKIETSYIYIDQGFKRCGLNNTNWIK